MSDNLLTMTEFVASRLRKDVDFADFVGQSANVCTICQDDLVVFRRDAERRDIVQLPSCSHIFHEECLATWMDSTSSNRNSARHVGKSSAS